MLKIKHCLSSVKMVEHVKLKTRCKEVTVALEMDDEELIAIMASERVVTDPMKVLRT